MTFEKLFGRRLKALREMRGISQRKLADKLGKSAQYVSRIETGDRKPSMDQVRKMAAALDVPVFMLFDFDADTSDPKVLRNEIAKLLEICDLERLQHVRRYVRSIL